MLGGGFLRAANSFVGAYDAIPSIAAAYSTRRLLTSYTGPLLRLVADRTGYPEQDIGYTAAGDLDTAAAASFLSGDAGYVTKWYDQSANAFHALQATLANMPLYVASAQNSKPVLRSAGAGKLATGSATIAQPMTAFAVFKKTSAIGGDVLFDGVTSRIQYWIYNQKMTIFAGANLSGATSLTQNQTYLFSGLANGASSEVWLNGASDVTGNAGTNSLTGGIEILSDGSSTYFVGDLSELILCSAALSTGNRQAAESAANAYWSIY